VPLNGLARAICVRGEDRVVNRRVFGDRDLDNGADIGIGPPPVAETFVRLG